VAKVIVHVNQHVIKHNAKTGSTLPALTIKHPRLGTRYAHEVSGRGQVIDSNARGRCALSCGARVWMEFNEGEFCIEGESWNWDTMKAKLYDEQDSGRSSYEQIMVLGDAIAP
jgi:hypothetical protein